MTSVKIRFRGLLEGAQSLRPHLVEMGTKTRHAMWIELVQPSRSLLDVGHQPCVLQHFQVLRNSRARDRQSPGQIVHRDRAAGKLLEYRHPRCIGKRVQSGL